MKATVEKRDSLRQTPPDPVTFEWRRMWGGRLLLELNSINKKPEWLGRQVGYDNPSSMRQVINGHQGISREVYDAICEVFPDLLKIFAPPMTKERKGPGAKGPHKDHDYPPGRHFRIRRRAT